MHFWGGNSVKYVCLDKDLLIHIHSRIRTFIIYVRKIPLHTSNFPTQKYNFLYLYHLGGWVVRRCHVSFVTRGVQLILAYSWARPAILVAGKGREVMFLFLLFLHFHSCFSFFPVPPFHLFCYLFCLFSPFLWETTQNDPQGLTCR